VKQNNCVRSIFFVNNRQSASPRYYQLLEILKFENIVKLKTAILTQKLFVNSSGVPSLFHNFLMPVKIFIVTIQGMQQDAFISQK
jgi:energy-converting hydrogenase Eha subunit B